MKTIQSQYTEALGIARRLEAEILHQLKTLLEDAGVTLANPLEHRIKSIDSLVEKFERKKLPVSSHPFDLPDFIGFRFVLLFQRDLDTVTNLIHNSFDVLDAEDTAQRLEDAQFGYQSRHYVCRIQNAWKQLPSFRNLPDIRFEMQVRTAAQHIWAAASHKLQYKQETFIPSELRRSIHRAAALLETVDLELERVLVEREIYERRSREQKDSDLNVVTVAQVLSEVWPQENNVGQNDDYSGIVSDLAELGIKTSAELRALLIKHREEVLQHDRSMASRPLHPIEEKELSEHQKIMRQKGCYYSQAGLTRIALERELGAAFLHVST